MFTLRLTRIAVLEEVYFAKEKRAGHEARPLRLGPDWISALFVPVRQSCFDRFLAGLN
jgi:hypothetical protein